MDQGLDRCSLVSATTETMSRLLRPIYKFADRLTATPGDVDVDYRARSRSMVIWSVFSMPFGVLVVLMSESFNLTSVVSISVLLGGFGMILAIAYLRVWRNLDIASFIFLVSVCIGLGAPPWFSPLVDVAPLVLLSVTPVFFGLIVNWRYCLRYTVSLSCYFAIMAVWAFSSNVGDPNVFKALIACSMAALGSGMSTVAYGHSTDQAARKLRHQKEEMEAIVFKDPLTGVSNRRAFNETVRSIASAVHPIRVAILDLDNFKNLNDRYGHDVGDAVLIAVASRIAVSLPEDGQVFRMGGDEFAIIFHDEDNEKGALIDRLLACADAKIETAIGPVSAEFSIGLSAPSFGGIDIKKLYRSADIALFEAKLSQGTSWHEFDNALDQRRLRRTQLSERLKIAVSQRTISVVFQPQFDITDNRVIGFEALARWKDDLFGEVNPGEFVSIAEEAEIVRELDLAVFQRSIAEAEPWIRDHQKLSINISGKTLLSPAFETCVEELLQATPLLASQIQIEITETELLRNTVLAQEIVRKLCDLGLTISLDDFGTGYSSLSYLSRLPIHQLKVDKSFIQGSELTSNITILKSIVGLARSLHMDLVVEGVERQNHLAVVKELGCTQVQGFYFSRPLTAAQCIQLSATQRSWTKADSVQTLSGLQAPQALPTAEQS